MNAAEMAKRPSAKPSSVPSLAETLGEMRSGTTDPGSRPSATATETTESLARKSPLFSRASLPERSIEAAGLDPGSLSWTKARKHALERCQQGGMVLLCGQRWTGKTVMAVSIALDYLAGGKGAVYTRGIGLLKDLRLDFNSNDLASREIVKPYQRWHLLIVDEVGLRVRGESGYSETDAALLTDLVDQRYASRQATILISNENPQQTFQKVGPSIARRIEEVGIVIEANWPPFGG